MKNAVRYIKFKISKINWFKLVFCLFSFTAISFLMKFLSEFTHEYLGHCCIGALVGGIVQGYYVSWIWPLEFGYAYVSFFGSVEPLPRILMYSGGIITCLTAAFLSQGIIFLIGSKKKKNSYALLIPFNLLFWYGFWAFMNSVGYLLVGGLINFGDIHQISNISGIPNTIFLIPGFIAFFLLYYLISNNFNHLFRGFIKIDTKWMLALFWLIIPIVYIFFIINPSISINIVFIAISFPLMFIPSIISIFLSRYFIKSKEMIRDF